MWPPLGHVFSQDAERAWVINEDEVAYCGSDPQKREVRGLPKVAQQMASTGGMYQDHGEPVSLEKVTKTRTDDQDPVFIT